MTLRRGWPGATALLCLLCGLLAPERSSAQVDLSDLTPTPPSITTPTAHALTVRKSRDLVFGRMVAGTGGTVTVRPQGNSHRSSTGGIVLMTVPGGQAAELTLEGEKQATVSVMLPTSVVLTRQGGSETMVVQQLEMKPTGPSVFLGGEGTLDLGVGATLVVDARQAGGLYSGILELTFAYE